jgi:hypothetical protein
MSSQVSQYGDQALVNGLAGAVTPIAAAFPAGQPTWVPGMVYYDTTNAQYRYWNGVAWVPTPATSNTPPLPANTPPRYLALLTADPVAGGVVNISDPGFIECGTAGYARQPITFGTAFAGYPSTTANNSVITFTMSSTMLVPVQWAALVTDPTAGNGHGLFLASWVLAQGYTVDASQNIQVGIGQLILQGN